METAHNLLRGVLAVAAFSVGYPALINLPVIPQSVRMLRFAFWLIRYSLWIQGSCVAVSLGVLAFAFIRGNGAPMGQSLALTGGVLLCALASRGDIYETIFHPLGTPRFASALETSLDERERVLTVALNGEVRAYPVRGVSYHHVVNDTIGDTPFAVTYCGLCHTGLVWRREVEGKVLTLHISGINDQNFLMRDDETDTYWQQVSGEAIAGPLRGKTLPLVRCEEVSFGLFRSENPSGLVLQPKRSDEKFYSKPEWEEILAKVPAVKRHAGEGFGPKDIMLSVQCGGDIKAFPQKDVLAAGLVCDRIGEAPVVVVVGPDGASFRAFRIPPTDFFRTDEGRALLMDAATGSKWNFQGCAVEGPETGQCLESLQLTRDYWFDWRSYHPTAEIYRPRG